mmetsp:Transcript_56453/g.115528  ORF Transcript_56453/g.115528 Transcript_56453/m.115528 type:complete len:115 (+) Transcript_56453:98-442(+)
MPTFTTLVDETNYGYEYGDKYGQYRNDEDINFGVHSAFLIVFLMGIALAVLYIIWINHATSKKDREIRRAEGRPLASDPKEEESSILDLCTNFYFLIAVLVVSLMGLLCHWIRR